MSLKHRPLLVTLMILGTLFLWFDISARVQFSKVNNEVEKIRHDFMEPAGAVEWIDHVNGYPDVRGNGYLEALGCLPDVKCPTIDRKWFVPVTPGQEEAFVRSILQREGYRIDLPNFSQCNSLEAGRSCHAFGIKENLQIGLGIDVTDKTLRLPDRDVSPKVWRVFGVGVSVL